MRILLNAFFVAGILFVLSPARAISKPAPSRMVLVGGGTYVPFTASKNTSSKKKPSSPSVRVEPFFLDRYLVTNEDYLGFVKQHPEWLRSKVRPIFADSDYLETWQADSLFARAKRNQPVTRISWFAANAYCQSFGKHLPTTDQWEFTLFDNGRNQERLKENILAWYGKTNESNLPVIGSTGENGFGISDLGVSVWEWTEDFNSFLSSTDSRDSGGKDANLFCGNGSQMGDASDYVAFMRYSFRSSLKASYTTANLGFRCAKDLTP